jgi:hypothetical protein
MSVIPRITAILSAMVVCVRKVDFLVVPRVPWHSTEKRHASLSPMIEQGMVNRPAKRTKLVKVYVFEEEKNAIKEKATATGQTASEYLRSCGLRRVLTAKPPADVITIRATAGTLKSELMMLSHLAKETNNQQIINQVEIAIALVDKTIAAAFNIEIAGSKQDAGNPVHNQEVEK